MDSVCFGAKKFQCFARISIPTFRTLEINHITCYVVFVHIVAATDRYIGLSKWYFNPKNIQQKEKYGTHTIYHVCCEPKLQNDSR